jgi:hypothetical protein
MGPSLLDPGRRTNAVSQTKYEFTDCTFDDCKLDRAWAFNAGTMLRPALAAVGAKTTLQLILRKRFAFTRGDVENTVSLGIPLPPTAEHKRSQQFSCVALRLLQGHCFAVERSKDIAPQPFAFMGDNTVGKITA